MKTSRDAHPMDRAARPSHEGTSLIGTLRSYGGVIPKVAPDVVWMHLGPINTRILAPRNSMVDISFSAACPQRRNPRVALRQFRLPRSALPRPRWRVDRRYCWAGSWDETEFVFPKEVTDAETAPLPVHIYCRRDWPRLTLVLSRPTPDATSCQLILGGKVALRRAAE